MAFTYTGPVDDRGVVRMLINDTDVDVPGNQCFSDAEIDKYLELEPDDVRLAAAAALDTMAASSAWIDKQVRLLDFSINGPAVADSLRKDADTLRCRVSETDTFDWAEMVLDESGLRERIFDDWQRQNS